MTVTKSALTRQSEADTLRSILALLRALHIPAWRNNSGVFQTGDRWIRAGIKGSADILGCLPPSGKMLCVEVKRVGKKPTPEQDVFLNTITRNGGIALVAYSAQDVLEAIRRVCPGMPQ